MDHNGIILDKNSSRHPGAQLILVQQFGSCETFIFRKSFFVFLYSNEHRRGDETRCCLSAGRFVVNHLNAQLGHPASCRLIQKQKRGQGRSEGNRKQFRPAAVHMTVSWRVVSRERQRFAEIKMAGSRDLSSERFIILNVLFFSYLAAVCSTAQVPVLIWTTER